MNNSLRNLSWRDLRGHVLRTLLTVASVAAGVAAVTSIHMSSSGAKQKFRQLEQSLVGGADLEVAADDGSLFDDKIADIVKQDPEVVQAVAELRRGTRLYNYNGKKIELHAVGLPPEPAAIEQLELKEGRFWSQGGDAKEVVLEAGLARAMNRVVGDKALFATLRGPQPYKVVGIVNVRNARAMARGDAAFFRLEDFQPMMRAVGKVNSVRIVLKDADQAEVVKERLATLVPAEVAVRRPAGYTPFAEETLRSVDLGLLFAKALAVVLGGCTILNTFLISVGERRRQWSILRAIGATQTQILRTILFEGLSLGILGSILGILVGLAGARLLSKAIAYVLQVTDVPLEWDLWLLVLAGLGPIVSVISAWIPALQAARVSPLEGMRGTSATRTENFPLAAALAALVIWGISAAIIAISLAGYLPPATCILAGVTMLLGFALWVPPLLPFIARFLSRLLSFWRCESEIAVRQTCRNQIRTSLTVAVLIVALANGIGMGHSLLNNVEDVRRWYQRAMLGDVLLQVNDSPLAFSVKEGTTEGELASLAVGTSVETMRFASVLVDKQSGNLIARRLPEDGRLPWDVKDVSDFEIRQRMKAGEVAVSTVLAQRLGVRVGDEIRIQLSGQSGSFRIACLVTDYYEGGLTVSLDRDVALKKLGLDGVEVFVLNFPAGKTSELMPAIDTLAAGKGLRVHSQEELKTFLDGMMLGVEAAFWVVLGLGMIVASFATFNTLTMNVLEQTREIGLLRMVGMSRRQVWRTIMAQALILGLLAVVLGLLAGLTSAYLMHWCSGPLLGRDVEFILRPGLIAGCLGVSLLLGCLAAGIPAHRAAQLPVLSAVQEE